MTTQENEEVKEVQDSELDEVLTAKDLTDPDSSDIGDAIVSDPENAPTEPEKETPPPASEELKPVEESESKADTETEDDKSVSVSDVPKEKTLPREVPNETPKERALRKEVERVKAKNRALLGKQLLENTNIEAEDQPTLSEDEQKALSQYDPEQLTNLENAFTVLAKKHGYVKKDEFSKNNYKDTAQTVLDNFLEGHPEYDEKNDPDGILWAQFQENYGMYKAPKNPRDLEKIFKRIHQDIFGIQTNDQDLRQVVAKQEKIKVASHSATSGGSKTSSINQMDTETKQLVDSGALKGFDPEELKGMGLG